MKNKYNVSEAEWRVLKMLWKSGEALRQSELLALFEEEGQEWKRQTLNTFLARLEKKGLVKREGRRVTPIYGEEEYGTLLMGETIDVLYEGKFSNLLASFMNRNKLSQEEIKELRQILDEKSKG